MKLTKPTHSWFVGIFTTIMTSLFLVALSICVTLPAAAEEAAEQQQLVDKAKMTLDRFLADPNMTWFRDNVKDAKGLFIVPELLKGAFIFGGEGGSGVLLVRDDKSGEWSQPAFYTMGGISFGLQAGGKSSEVILMVLSDKGLKNLYLNSFKLGADASVAAGPVGAGASGGTAPNLSADYLSFARSKGAFGGLSLEGSVIKAREGWNEAYYGKPTPVDTIVSGDISNPKSAELREAVKKATQ